MYTLTVGLARIPVCFIGFLRGVSMALCSSFYIQAIYGPAFLIECRHMPVILLSILLFLRQANRSWQPHYRHDNRGALGGACN